MPKAVHKRFTVLQAKNLKTPGLHADGDGLYLRITKSGSKSWVMRYMIAGKSRSIGLGSFHRVSLGDARDAVTRLHQAIKEGRDPIRERDGKSDGLTFAEAAQTYIAENQSSWKNAKHRQQWTNTIRDYAIPAIGNRGIADVDSNDVWRVLEPIWRSKPETARRVKQRMHAVIDWAIAKRHRTDMNPVDALRRVLPKQPKAVKHHAALAYVDVPTFLDDLKASNSNRFVRMGLEFLIHTACRTSEVLGAKWDEINNDVWTVPADRMKAGKEHRVPLTEQTLVLLEQIRKIGVRSDYVFPGRSWDAPLSQMAFSMAMRRIGYQQFTVHGFRSSFRDWAAEQTNVDRDVCEAALAHSIGNKVEAAYRRTDLFEKRRALMSRWSDFLASERGKVVSIGACR